MTIPTPTFRIRIRQSNETVRVTEWTIGAYTLRKSEGIIYTDWYVINVDRTLPRIEGGHSEFGVSCSSISDLSPEDAIAYATQLAEAAGIAATFNGIIAAAAD